MKEKLKLIETKIQKLEAEVKIHWGHILEIENVTSDAWQQHRKAYLEKKNLLEELREQITEIKNQNK